MAKPASALSYSNVTCVVVEEKRGVAVNKISTLKHGRTNEHSVNNGVQRMQMAGLQCKDGIDVKG